MISNSPLINYVRISPNKTSPRNHAIDRITPHCIVGQCTAEGIGEWFAEEQTQASSNYSIDRDGRIGMYCEEKDRSWCSSSRSNDHRAITIECASDTTHPYAFREIVYERLVELCVDICNRNGKTKLLWFGDKDKSLNYEPAPNEMVLTAHRWLANTACPGDWMYSRMGDLAERVNAVLNPAPNPIPEADKWYRVRKSWDNPSSQIGAYKILDNAKNACINGYTVYDWNGVAVYSKSEPEYTFRQFVTDVQIAIGAGVDGIPGPETLSKTPTISMYINNMHAVVRPLQRWLYALGYKQVGEADSIAGPMFDEALKAFQRDTGCYIDGEATAMNLTWQKLLWLV